MLAVHLVCRPAAGGIKTHVAGLSCDLPALGWKPVIHAPISLLDSLPPCEKLPLSITSSTGVSDLFTAITLAKQIPAGSLLHAHGIRAAWVCALARGLKNFSFLTTLHNVPQQGLIGKSVLQVIGNQSAGFICVSQEIARSVKKFKHTVIPNGIEVDTKPPVSRAQIRQELAIEAGNFVVCTVARLSPEKGVDILNAAAARLPDVQFIVAGDGPIGNSLRSNAPTNVKYLGYRPDVISLLAASDCAAFPSRSEGQGIGVLEAMSVGIPVVATRVGGIPESLTNGVTGLLIASNNPVELASAIAQVKQDPVKHLAMADRGRTWVLANRQRQQQSRLVAEQYGLLLAR